MRLPPALAPWWPVAKKAHRMLTRVVGAVARRLPFGDRAVPRRVYLTSVAAAAAEPGRVRVIESGPSEQLDRQLPSGNRTDLAFWPAVVRHDVPERTVVELAPGRLVGHYGASITAAGVLDLQTSPYFGALRWQEHPIFLNLRLPAPERVAGTVVSLVSHASSYNYYHALMDAVPRWGMVQEAFADLAPDAVVVGNRSRWDRQLVAMLGLDRYRLIHPDSSLSIQADRLLVPALIDAESHGPRWITEYLRRALPPRDVDGRPARLYVSRGSVPNTRRVVHEVELVQRLAERGFVAIDPGALSVQDQIDHFAAAEVVVAPHGAGLVNLNFASPGVRVLELFAADYLNPAFFSITDNIPGSTYRFLVSEGGDPGRLPAQMKALGQDIPLSVDSVLAAVDDLLS